MRVRTTSASEAPARSSAARMLASACTACAYGSPAPTMAPPAPVAVVPETWTCAPTRTAREYPTIGSHGVPLDTLSRWPDASPAGEASPGGAAGDDALAGPRPTPGLVSW